ncbi:MAG: CvpA family protein, partial [Pseudomonadota bacterium]
MADWPINPMDLVVLIILILSAVLAFARGFVREVLSIGGWIGAAIVTVYMLPQAREYGRQYIASELIADLATAAVLFIAALVVFAILSFWLAKLVQGSALNAVDRSLGFA